MTMSVDKLTKRIVTPDIDLSSKATQRDLHDFTHGITSDPLTQFAWYVEENATFQQSPQERLSQCFCCIDS